jgi:hypothetical protein
LRGLVWALALATVAGCADGFDDGYAVDLTARAGRDLDAPLLGRVRTLELEVAGAEQATASYMLARPFASGREERVIYRPLVRSGRVTIVAIGREVGGGTLVDGATLVALRPGETVAATVVLERAQPPLPDAAVDAPADPCAGRPDGYNLGPTYLERCCGGSPARLDSVSSCGACGIQCQGTNACINVGGAWQCACATGADCWSRCCGNAAGMPFVCEPSSCGSPPSCIACPGNAACMAALPHYYCHY